MNRNSAVDALAEVFPLKARSIKPGDVVGGPKMKFCLLDGVYEIEGSNRRGRVISVIYGTEGQSANVWWEDEDEPMVVDLDTLTLTPRQSVS